MPVKKKQKEADLPVYLFHQGNNFEAYRYLGAHCTRENGEDGVMFRWRTAASGNPLFPV